ncbi:MAG: hypothetical protein EOO88_19210, partial [Pedobacter sp.]
MIPIYQSYKSILLVIFYAMTVLIQPGCKKGEKIIQPTIEVGSVRGNVSNEYGEPIKGAAIELTHLSGTKKIGSTDSEGNFAIQKLSTGSYQISVSKDNFIAQSRAALVEKNSNVKYDFSLKVGKSTLTVNTDTLSADHGAQSFSVLIKSNAGWVISTDAHWIGLSRSGGNGNQQITLSVLKNESELERKATITVTSGTEVKTLTLTQDCELRLTNVSLGELANDSITVNFNKSITLIELTSKSPYCHNSNIGTRVLSEGTAIRFSNTCGILANGHPYSVTVKDKTKTHTILFNTRNGKDRIHYEPQVIAPTYFVTDDNRYIWFSLYYSNKIQQITVDGLSVKKEYTYPFSIKQLSYNPYNHFIYALTDSPDIYVIDPANGSVVKHIKVEPIPGDFPYDPDSYPQTIVFTASGLGAMICVGLQHHSHVWKMIDSRKNDVIYYHPKESKIHLYGDIHANYNRTKLYFNSMDSSGEIFYFDPLTDEIVDVQRKDGLFGRMVTNRKNDNIFIVQAYEQYIHNPITGYYSNMSFNGNGGEGAFSYLPGEEEVVYVVTAQNYLLALDYALRSSFAQRDEATLLSALRNHGRRVGARQMFAIGVDGAVQADTRGDYRVGERFPYEDLTDGALERPASAVVAWQGGAYWMVVVPVFTPNLSGFIAAMIPVDDRLLSQLQGQSTLPKRVELASLGQDGRWTLLAQGNAPAGMAGTLLSPHARLQTAPATVDVRGREYVVQGVWLQR